MSHNIFGYIVKREDFSKRFLEMVPHRDLKQGFVFIPDSQELIDNFLWISKKKEISELEVVASFSEDQCAAWVETDYFGGMGEQGASIFLKGAVEHFPENINGALKLLGVSKEPGNDLFDSVGLGDFRHNHEIIDDFRKKEENATVMPETLTGRLIQLAERWYVDHSVRDGNSFIKELVPLCGEDSNLSLFSDSRGRMLNRFQTVKFNIINEGGLRVAKILWPSDEEKDLNRELRTGENIYKLFEDFFEGKILYDEMVALIFLALSRARSEGHTAGWDAATKKKI